MNGLSKNRVLVTLFVGAAAAWSSLAPVSAAPLEDPEDSPLFANSVRHAFTLMEARGRGLTLRSEAAAPRAAVILVSGTRWYNAAEVVPVKEPSGKATQGGGPIRGGPLPRDITTDVTCDVTCSTSCMFTSCGSTCDATPTCRGYISCHVPQPTCANFSCGTGPTCSGSLTCPGYATCDYQSTCIYSSTCNVMQPTCAGSPTCTDLTCQGTCVPADCRVGLFDVQVPTPGQIQVSFTSSAALKYTLQCSTNSSVTQWMEALTTNGNGGILSLRHTNNAPLALYRLLIQTP